MEGRLKGARKRERESLLNIMMRGMSRLREIGFFEEREKDVFCLIHFLLLFPRRRFPKKKNNNKGGLFFFRAKWIVGGCEKIVLLEPFVPMVGDDAPEIHSHSHTPRKKENIL